MENGNTEGFCSILNGCGDPFVVSPVLVQVLPRTCVDNSLVAPMVASIAQTVTEASKVADGPLRVSPMILSVIRDTSWWIGDLKLINLLFTTLKKGIAAKLEIGAMDGKLLIRTAADRIRESCKQAGIGRATRFFLSFLSDLVLFTGAHQEDSTCLQVSMELLNKCSYKNQHASTEHIAPTEMAVKTFIQRLLTRMSAGDVNKAMVYMDSLNNDIGALRTLLFFAQQKMSFDLSEALVANALQNMFDGMRCFGNEVLDNESLHREVYVGLGSLLFRLSQPKAESFLFDNMLAPHLLSSNMLGSLWALFVRHAADEVQEHHLSVLLDCIQRYPDHKHSLCKFRVIRLFRIVCLNSSTNVQKKMSHNDNALFYFPSQLQDLDEATKDRFSCSLKNTAPSLTEGGEVLPKLASVSRIGAANLAHETAHPLSKTASEIYLRVGNSMTMREKRSVMVLFSSLSNWFGDKDLLKFLTKVGQQGRASLMNVILLQKLCHLVDSNFIQPMSVMLHSALQQRKWYIVIAAIKSFHFLSTHCSSLTEADIQQLAGNHLSMIANCLGLTATSIASQDMNMSSKMDCVTQATLAAVKQQSVSIPGGAVGDDVETFARLTRNLADSAKQLESFGHSELVQGERFQSDLSCVISILTQLQRN